MIELGGCLIFAWGPPWNWLPKLCLSTKDLGISLVWLWFGLYLVRRGIGSLVVYSEVYCATNSTSSSTSASG